MTESHFSNMMNLEKLVISDLLGFGEMIEISCSQLYTGGQSLYVCRDTGLVRAKNVRSPHEIAKAWSDDVFGDTFDEKTYTARIPAVRARQTYVADFADSYIGLKGKMCCDLGAGEGQFLEIIAHFYRANVFGIEPSHINCNRMLEKKIKCFIGTAEEYIDSPTFRPQAFDVVTAMWTLVNSSQPLHLLKTAFESLKNGGYLVVAEGSRILVPFKKPLHYYFSTLPVDLHPFHFSANSLTNLVRVAGFKIIALNRFVDSDYLCIVAQKQDTKELENIQFDNCNEVLDFFERWHLETARFYREY